MKKLLNIPTPMVHLQPNPHANHNFEGTVTELILDSHGSGLRYRETPLVEKRLEEYLNRPHSKVRKIPNKRYLIEPGMIIAGEWATYRVFDLHEDQAPTLNEDLTNLLNRPSRSMYDTNQSMIALQHILPHAIVWPENTK